jgi:hypothetical protein
VACPLFIKIVAVIEIIKNGTRFRIEPDMPDPTVIVYFLNRLYRRLDAEQMCYPGFENPAERIPSSGTMSNG